MLLTEAKCGDKVKIKEFIGENTMVKKIEGMGIRKGDIFEVLRIWGRNILLRNGVNRLVISCDIARNIEIELIEAAKEAPCEGKRRRRKRHRWGWF